jgi:hypothetical protein
MIKLGITYVWALNVITILEIEGSCCAGGCGSRIGSEWMVQQITCLGLVDLCSKHPTLLQLFVEMSGFVHQTDCSWFLE